MKKIQIIILSLLVASSAFAWGENERSALLGFGAGVIVSQLVNNHDRNYNTRVSYEDRIVHKRPVKVCRDTRYITKRKHHKVQNNHYTKRHHNGHNKHHRKNHRKHHNDTVVVNHYRSNYYY